MQGREGVVGNLRAGIGDRRDQGGLARIGHAQQAHIGQHAQFQLQAPGLAGPAGCLLAGRPVGAALEMQVAETPIAALGDQHLFAWIQQLRQNFAGVGIRDDRPHGHAQDDVISRGTELIGTPAGLTVAGLETAGVAVVDQRVQVQITHGMDAAATPAIATVGPAERNEFLAPEAHAACSAMTCGDVDERFVNKLHDFRTFKDKPRPRPGLTASKRRPIPKKGDGFLFSGAPGRGPLGHRPDLAGPQTGVTFTT